MPVEFRFPVTGETEEARRIWIKIQFIVAFDKQKEENIHVKEVGSVDEKQEGSCCKDVDCANNNSSDLNPFSVAIAHCLAYAAILMDSLIGSDVRDA